MWPNYHFNSTWSGSRQHYSPTNIHETVLHLPPRLARLNAMLVFTSPSTTSSSSVTTTTAAMKYPQRAECPPLSQVTSGAPVLPTPYNKLPGDVLHALRAHIPQLSTKRAAGPLKTRLSTGPYSCIANITLILILLSRCQDGCRKWIALIS